MLYFPKFQKLRFPENTLNQILEVNVGLAELQKFKTSEQY